MVNSWLVPDSLRWFVSVKESLYTRRRGNLTFARPVFQGLRIAHLSRTSNAESPRRYVLQTIYFLGKKYTDACINISGGRLCCYLSFRQVKSCEVLKYERQTLINVFFINKPLSPAPTLGLSAEESFTKVGKNGETKIIKRENSYKSCSLIVEEMKI